MIKDPWKKIRQACFGNIEPTIDLVAMSSFTSNDVTDMDSVAYTESLPALAAGTSYDKKVNTTAEAKALNKKLIKMEHLVPLESVQFNFLVRGISKACGAQLSRHRIGQGHVSLSRRYTKQKANFIYPLFDYVEEEPIVRSLYTQLSVYCETSLAHYKSMLDDGVKKQDSRLFMPVNVATERSWWINARALRDLFRLRLDPAAEWEIRRVSFILLDIVYKITPSLFQDIYEKYVDIS